MAEKHPKREQALADAGPLVPRWALVIAAAMVALGVVLLALRPVVERRAAIAMLNGAYITVNEAGDGFDDRFGLVSLERDQRQYERLLSDCHLRPELAYAIFRDVLSTGSSEGRILACTMAFYLAQDRDLGLADLDLVLKQLDGDKASLRHAAQRTLANLLVLRDADKAGTYEAFPAPPEAKDRIEAKTQKIRLQDAPPGATWLSVRWSNPAACKAWWQRFGKSAQWDRQLRRFVIAE
jgi:hypothetical protein